MLTKYFIGRDGLTAYMRLHGRHPTERICEFGERVCWFVPAKRRTKLEPRWLNGVFLGRAYNSDQNFVGLSDGTVTTARAMVRVVPSCRRDKDRLLRVSGTPLALNTANFDSIEDTDDPHRGPPGHREDGLEDEHDELARRVPIVLKGFAQVWLLW